MNPSNITVAPEFFTLAAVVLAFEYYLGVLLYSTPIMGRVKGWGVSLMRGSVEPMFFLFMMNCLFAFLLPFEPDILDTAQRISDYAVNIKALMVSYQMINYQIMAGAGTTAFFTALVASIARWIYTVGAVPPNPWQILSAASQTALAAADVLKPVSSLYGTAIVVQTFLGAFAQMLVYNLAVFVNIGVILYIMPLRITRGTGRTLIGFSLMGYALLPLYEQLQTFVSDWMNSAINGQWFSGIVGQLQPLQVGVMDVLVPALYFGFLIWLVGAVAGGDVIGRISSKATGGVDLMTPVDAVQSAGRKLISIAGGKVEGVVLDARKAAKVTQSYNKAKNQVNAAVMAGKIKGGLPLAQKQLAKGMQFYHVGMFAQAGAYFNMALASVQTAREPTDEELQRDFRNAVGELSPDELEALANEIPADQLSQLLPQRDDDFKNWADRTNMEMAALDQKSERVQSLFIRTMGISPKSMGERQKQKKRVNDLVVAYRAKYRSGQIPEPALKQRLYALRLSEGKVQGMIEEDNILIQQQHAELSDGADAETQQPEFLDRSGRGAVEWDMAKFEKRITTLMNTIQASNWQDQKAMEVFAAHVADVDQWLMMTTNTTLASRVRAFQTEFNARSKAEYDTTAQYTPGAQAGMHPDEGGLAMSEEELSVVAGQTADSVLYMLQRRIETSIRHGSLDKKAIEQYDKFVREGLDPLSPLAHKAIQWKENMLREVQNTSAQPASQRGWPPEQQSRPPLVSSTDQLQGFVNEEEVLLTRREKGKSQRDKVKRDRTYETPLSKGKLKKMTQELHSGDDSSIQQEMGVGELPTDEVPESRPKTPEPAEKKGRRDAEEKSTVGDEQADTLIDYLKKGKKVKW